MDAPVFVDVKAVLEGNRAVSAIRFANSATGARRRLMEDRLEIFHRGRLVVNGFDFRDDDIINLFFAA